MQQISTVLVQSWRANCDIQLLLYDSDPYNPNLAEFAKVADYIVSYITKGNIGYLVEQKIMKELIQKWVFWKDKVLKQILIIATATNSNINNNRGY